MTNLNKRKVLLFISAILVLFIGLFTFFACSAKNKKAQFMVKNNDGQWAVLQESDINYSNFKMPVAPEKEYYDFGGWFSNKDLTKPFDASKDLKEKTKNGIVNIYAKYIPQEVSVVYDGKNLGTKNTADVVNNMSYNTNKELDFDGWYKDPNYKVKWDNKEVVKNLYARTVANIVINNGYEDVYTTKITPGEVFESPLTQKIKSNDNTETTIEQNILNNRKYMSDKDISYVDSNNKDFDFTKAIEKNTNITMLWNSKVDDTTYRLNKKTGNYCLQGANGTFGDAPVISIQSKATIRVDENGKPVGGDKGTLKTVTVEAIDNYGGMLRDSKAVKAIIGEGIKVIKGFGSETTIPLESVVIPSTCKIIDKSFDNMPKLKDVQIPEGVEVIINSFFKKMTTVDAYADYALGQPYDYDINIPKSVINMAMVGNNFTFEKGSSFFKENGYIYQNTEKGKVLISDPNAYSNYLKTGSTRIDVNTAADTIKVPDGTVGIQVGTYSTVFNYLILPKSFKFMNFNVDIKNYPFYYHMDGSDYSKTNNMLYDETALETPRVGMHPDAFTISRYLNGLTVFTQEGGKPFYSGKVVFTADIPKDLYKYAFSGDVTGYSSYSGAYVPMTDESMKDAVIIKNNENKAYITVSYVWTETIINPDSPDDPQEKLTIVCVNLIDNDAVLNENNIKEQLIEKFPEDKREELKKATFTFYQDNKEITLDKVSGNMFITAMITIPEANS